MGKWKKFGNSKKSKNQKKKKRKGERFPYNPSNFQAQISYINPKFDKIEQYISSRFSYLKLGYKNLTYLNIMI